MAMNFAPLDCPYQGASSESKKYYPNFFILEKIAKNQKIHIFGSHSKKWVQWPKLLLYLNSTDPIL
jgi:adenine-specific DNA methylase